MPTQSKRPTTLARYLLLLGGAQDLLPPTGQITVAGTAYSFPEVLAHLENKAAPLRTVATARQSLRNARSALKHEMPSIKAFADAFEAAMKGYLGPADPRLAQLGIKPAADRTPLTAEQKVMKKARLLATREARGTKGSKQRQAIKATSVPAQVVDDTGMHAAELTASSASAQAAASVEPAISTEASTPAGSAKL